MMIMTELHAGVGEKPYLNQPPEKLAIPSYQNLLRKNISLHQPRNNILEFKVSSIDNLRHNNDLQRTKMNMGYFGSKSKINIASKL